MASIDGLMLPRVAPRGPGRSATSNIGNRHFGTGRPGLGGFRARVPGFPLAFLRKLGRVG